jgi:hypothetical protein
MDSGTQRSAHKPARLPVWGDSMLNKLKSLTRRRRKREASKKRRVALKKRLPE